MLASAKVLLSWSLSLAISTRTHSGLLPNRAGLPMSARLAISARLATRR